MGVDEKREKEADEAQVSNMEWENTLTTSTRASWWHTLLYGSILLLSVFVLFADYFQSVWLSSMFYLACLGFVKTSVLWFYTRLGDRYLTRLSYTMFGVVTAQATANVLVAAFQCQPVAKAWATTLPGHCVDINVFYLCNAALNIFTDVLTYTLPIKVIFNLQIPRKQKIALVFTLSLGLLWVLTGHLLHMWTTLTQSQRLRLVHHSNHLHPRHA